MTALRVDYDGAIATITFTRPEKRNAISYATMSELSSSLSALASDAAVRVVILTGEGKAFCAGMDLEMLQAAETTRSEDARKMAAMFLGVYRFPKPIIAAVNGAAIAGGCGLATLCDFTVAVPEASFGYTEVRIGFLPALVSVFLTRQIGGKAASDLLLTGRIVKADEALRIGLITEVAENLAARVREISATSIANSPESLTRTKRLVRSYSDAALDRDIELALAENAAIRETADFREGVASFLEKRKPKWQ
jgi:methylglutaconyl-CoA hydratase